MHLTSAQALLYVSIRFILKFPNSPLPVENPYSYFGLTIDMFLMPASALLDMSIRFIVKFLPPTNRREFMAKFWPPRTAPRSGV